MPASSGPRRQAPHSVRCSASREGACPIEGCEKKVENSAKGGNTGLIRNFQQIVTSAEREPSALIDMVQSSLGEDLPLAVGEQAARCAAGKM